MAAPIIPDPDFVLAKKIKPEAKTKAGILLTESTLKEVPYVQIVAVGANAKNRKVGQKVFLSDEFGSATAVSVDGDKNEYVLVRNDKIIGTVA